MLIAAVVVFALLLLRKPRGYVQPKPIVDKTVSQYLTNVLMPQFYNGVQSQEPFAVEIVQQGVNEIISKSKWPQKTGGATFMVPKVYFVPGYIVVMGTVVVKDVEFVATVIAAPVIDEQGLMNIKLEKIKVGRADITLLAKIVGRQIYNKSVEGLPIRDSDIGIKAASSLLNNEPFDPVFKIDGRKARIKNITIEKKKLTIEMTPVED